MSRDIQALTSLRGLAAWWVVLYHIRDMIRLEGRAGLAWWLLGMAALLAEVRILIASHFLYHWIEKPAQRAILTDFKWRPAPVSAYQG